MKFSGYTRIVAVCLLALSIIISMAACSDKGEQPPTSDDSEVYIVKTELIDGELIVTYSDGRVENIGPISGESDSDSLSFYPLPDGTYGITAGNTIYLEGIAIPEKYRGRAVSTILNDAFKGNENLKTVTIPESIVSIGASAFSGCKNLEEADLPEGLLNVGASAFNGCEKLTELRVPDTVESIGAQAFYMCAGLNSITLPVKPIAIGGSAFYGTALYDNTENWTEGVLYIGEHLIDAKAVSTQEYGIKENTVTVANYAFADCDTLKAIAFPDSLSVIGGSAFVGCDALETASFLNNATLNSIGESAFAGCVALREISLPDTVAAIEKDTFSGCTALTDVHLNADSSQLVKIGERSFSDCTSLRGFLIPNSVEAIEKEAFSGCTSLTEAVIAADNSKLSLIGDEAFMGCEKLARITLPLSLTEIGKNAFSECTALSEISYPATEKEWKKNVQKGSDWNKNTPEKNMVFKEEVSED